jgi:hypothetical protein
MECVLEEEVEGRRRRAEAWLGEGEEDVEDEDVEGDREQGGEIEGTPGRCGARRSKTALRSRAWTASAARA